MPHICLKGPIFDGTEYSDDGVVVVDQTSGTISAVGRSGEVEEPKDATIVSVRDTTILPGLIDAHMHFFGCKGSDLLELVTKPDIELALRSVHHMQQLLNAGFTYVRDLGSKVGTYLSRAVDEGLVDGPRIVTSGRSLGQTGGDDDPVSLPLDLAHRLSYSYYCDGPWECRKAVRMLVRDGAGVVKVYASGSFSQGGRIRTQFTVEELKTIVDEAHRVGLRVAGHAYGEEALANIVEAGMDSIEHGIGLTPEIAERIKSKGMFYVPTISAYLAFFKLPSDNKERDKLIQRHYKEDMEIAKQFGLKIVAGTDYGGSDRDPHGDNAKEIVNLAKFFGNKEALIAGTAQAANCLGLTNTGRIKKGFDADLIVVRGNPLKNPETLSQPNIVCVVARGKLHRLIS